MFTVQIFCGKKWINRGVFHDLVTACHYASRLYRHENIREFEIRIVDSNNMVL